MSALSIAMVSAGFRPAIGGAEVQALTLSRALVARGHKVTVLTRRFAGVPDQEWFEGVEIRRLAAPGAGAMQSTAFMFSVFAWLLVHRGEWAAVHVHLAGSPALAAAAAARILGRPVVVKLGGGRGIGELATSARSLLGRLKIAALGALRPKLIAVAQDLADEAAEVLSRPRAIVIPNGVDIDFFRPATPERRRAVRARLGWKDDWLVFLYTGRFSSEKRLPWFLGLWAGATGPQARAVLVGNGAERTAIEACGGDGRVLVLPPRDDLRDYYAAADVFILPSFSEGLSNSLLEAMASGLAILASRVGGSAEALENGVSGILFPRDDEARVRVSISGLADDPRLREILGAQAREDAVSRYSMASVVERLERLYLGEA